MISINRIDLTKLALTTQRFTSELHVPAREAIRTQTSLFMKEAVEGAPPQNLDKAQTKAQAQIKRAFYIKPPHVFTGKQAANGKRHRTAGNTRWLYAAPNALVGINPENIKTSASAQELSTLLRESKPGAKWIQTGERGPQKVMIPKKPMIGQGAFDRLSKFKKSQFGKLKASFAVGRDAVQGTWRLAAWIARHLKSGQVRGQFINDLDRKNQPSFTIISTARGCTSDANIKNINRALATRAAKAAKDLKNQLRGLYKKSGFKTN